MMPEQEHVDQFIDYGYLFDGERRKQETHTAYARWCLAQYRFPAGHGRKTPVFVPELLERGAAAHPKRKWLCP